MGMVTWNLERNADRWLTVANYAQANGVVALQELPRTTGNGEVTPPHGAVRTTRTFGNPNDAAYVWGRAKRSVAPAAVILSRNPLPGTRPCVTPRADSVSRRAAPAGRL